MCECCGRGDVVIKHPNPTPWHLQLRGELEQLGIELRRRLHECQVVGLDEAILERLEAAADEVDRVAYAIEHGHLPCCFDAKHGGEIDAHLSDDHRAGWHTYARQGVDACPDCRAERVVP